MKPCLYLKRRYYNFDRFPIWMEYHIDKLIHEFKYSEGITLLQIDMSKGPKKAMYEKELEKIRAKHQKKIREEVEKLDKVCEILCTSDIDHREAERDVYGEVDGFYKEFEKLKKKEILRRWPKKKD